MIIIYIIILTWNLVKWYIGNKRVVNAVGISIPPPATTENLHVNQNQSQLLIVHYGYNNNYWECSPIKRIFIMEGGGG